MASPFTITVLDFNPAVAPNLDTALRMKKLLCLAIRVMARSHKDALSMDGTPYLMHPIRIMLAAEELYGYEEQIVAVLHDTLEDTSLTITDLQDMSFPPRILTALLADTKQEGEAYEQYIGRVSQNAIATRVKMLDLADNINTTRLPQLSERDLARIAKYHRAIQYLKPFLARYNGQESGKEL